MEQFGDSDPEGDGGQRQIWRERGRKTGDLCPGRGPCQPSAVPG